MDKVDQIFKQLDDWRNLPTYQLERRADIFFSVYLREILEDCIGTEIHEIIIPEFPLHKGTLKTPWNDQSFRADYFALSKDASHAFLVELKTDIGSGRTAQDEYLELAKDAGLPALLEGVRSIMIKTNAKRKYFCLLKKLEALGLVRNLGQLESIMSQDRLNGFKTSLDQIQFQTSKTKLSLICIQPKHADKKTPYDNIVSFEKVRKIVVQHKDSLSQRFSDSLKAWDIEAGDCFR